MLIFDTNDNLCTTRKALNIVAIIQYKERLYTLIYKQKYKLYNENFSKFNIIFDVNYLTIQINKIAIDLLKEELYTKSYSISILLIAREFFREYMQIIIDTLDMLSYNFLYNTLVNFNIISLFKSIKSLAFTKKTISIFKDIKRIEFEEIVNLLARKLQKVIDDFVLSTICERQIIAYTTNIEYCLVKSLDFFDNKNNKCICFFKKKRELLDFLTNKSFIVFTTNFKKRELISKVKLSNCLIIDKNKLI